MHWQDQALHPHSCPSAVPSQGFPSSCCHRSTDREVPKWALTTLATDMSWERKEQAFIWETRWLDQVEEPRWFRAPLRMKLRSMSPWQGARGWLMWIQLPAALLAVLAPEGLGKHSTDLEKSMSAWA